MLKNFLQAFYSMNLDSPKKADALSRSQYLLNLGLKMLMICG